MEIIDPFIFRLAIFILSIFVLIADPVVLYFVMRKLKYTRRNAFLAGITAAQVSEFGFILIFKGRELGYLHGVELAILTLTALITIVISSYFITYNEQIYQKIRPFLREYPFTYKRALVSIVFYDSNNNYWMGHSVDFVFNIRGEIFYKTFDPQTKKFCLLHKEPYEKSLEIVRNKNNAIP